VALQFKKKIESKKDDFLSENDQLKNSKKQGWNDPTKEKNSLNESIHFVREGLSSRK